MRQSKLFPKTLRSAPKGAESVNHKLLVRAGFIDQLMAGSWSLLPLGWRVVNKINNIIRDELDKIGAQELLMPLMHPKEIWNETGRWEKAKEVMYQFEDSREREFALSFTHEEILLDIIRKHVDSYNDLPVALYHFSTKFRNEPRARSGILRGREFLMKDLYSVHADKEDFWDYYEKVRETYINIFKKLGFEVKVTEAAGGVFTDSRTHEFQVIAEGGEDLIYYCDQCEWGENQEVFKGKVGEKCKSCKAGIIKSSKSIEVGNIFSFGTSYSEKMKVIFTDEQGENKYVYFGSYGIGSTRVMGAMVEVSHDDKGIIWPVSMAPFDVHLISLEKVEKRAEVIYKQLIEEGIEVLWDDREESAGVKFADADLIGIPVRLVVSKATKDKVEWKRRNEEKTNIFSLGEVIEKLEKLKI